MDTTGEKNISVLGDDPGLLKAAMISQQDEISQLTWLCDSMEKLLSLHNQEQIQEGFLLLVEEITNYHHCVLYLFGDAPHQYSIQACRGITAEEVQTKYQLEADILRWVIKENRWTVIPGEGNGNEDFWVSILPLVSAGKEIGFLLLNTCPDQRIFTQGNLRRLTYIASYVALALENGRLYQNIVNTKNYLKDIIENINEGILTLGIDGNISLLNRNVTALLGLASADIVGQSCQHCLSPELKRAFDIIIGQTFKQGYVMDYRLDHTPQEGQSIPLAINCSLLRDEKGVPNGVIITLRDLTTSLELQRFRELDAIKDEFISNVSHELRTPLGIITSYIEALLERVKPEDLATQRKFLSIANQACDRITGLVNNLLDLSQIESGRFFLDLKRVNLKDIAVSVVKSLELCQGEVEVQLALAQDLPYILADEEKIYQAILNIASNALKYSPVGRTVLIKVFKDNSMVKLMVQDEGVGIPEDELPYVFEKFYRSSSSAGGFQGSGLGLPIAKHIVEAHQGTIGVESTLGKGSIFTISLPFPDGNERGGSYGGE